MAGEIFISYRRSDQDKARLLHALLKQRGVDAWYDALVGAGEDWRLKTAQALEVAPIFVLLFSKVASESDDISKELAAATFSKKLVIPVRIDNIKPQGAFLYELASRNWFDAFEDTEARFEILADKLAALVKGGPEAEVAAFNLGAPQPPPVIKPAPKPLFKRPAVLGGIAAAGVAVIAAVALFAMGPQASQATAPASQRIAFFGFTTTSDDPAAKAMAEAATDQTFQTMGLAKLDSAARADTVGTPADNRLDRAGKLGALYSLSGEVRPNTDGMTLSVRLEDVASRMTLWEKSVSGPASEAGLLPAQAAWPTKETMVCIADYRSLLTHDTPQLLKRIADMCKEGTTAGVANILLVVSHMRDLAQADPSSAGLQNSLSNRLALSVPSAPASARPAVIAEAEAALKRASELDPKLPLLILSRMYIAQAKEIPLAEYDALVLDVIAQTEGKDARGFGTANAFYAFLLQVAGRQREARPYASAYFANNPATPNAGITLGLSYAILRESSRARAEFEQAFARDPSARIWDEWIFRAIFLGAGDADEMLRSPPSFVPKSVVDCYSDIRTAYVSKDPKARSIGARRASECRDAGDLGTSTTLATLAALGDLDGAFALAGIRQPLVRGGGPSRLEPLFWPTSRAMRADPRFLPLVEKLGLMEYWRATKSQPDACETEDVPFCRELKAAKP